MRIGNRTLRPKRFDSFSKKTENLLGCLFWPYGGVQARRRGSGYAAGQRETPVRLGSLTYRLLS